MVGEKRKSELRTVVVVLSRECQSPGELVKSMF